MSPSSQRPSILYWRLSDFKQLVPIICSKNKEIICRFKKKRRKVLCNRGSWEFRIDSSENISPYCKMVVLVSLITLLQQCNINFRKESALRCLINGYSGLLISDNFSFLPAHRFSCYKNEKTNIVSDDFHVINQKFNPPCPLIGHLRVAWMRWWRKENFHSSGCEVTITKS